MWQHGPGVKGGTELIKLRRIEELAEELYSCTDELICEHATAPGSSDIKKLELQGCRSDNWNLVCFTTESDLSLIKNCSFTSKVFIHLPNGTLSDTSFENCRIEGPLKVRSNILIASMTLLPDSTVENNGSILWDSTPGVMNAFINAGVETGERQVPVIPHLDHNDVYFLGSGAGRNTVKKCIAIRERIIEKLSGVIGRNSIVRNCSSIHNSVFMNDVKIDNATAVRGSILMTGASVKDGALVRNSILQWNALADSFAIIENSILGECTVAERHGKLSDSFLGANSVLGEGEVTASLVGPLTGIHHQSLLIAASWPGGRGNIGYGANIGSNHTSRLPDQEIRPGTGQFFGLSTSVKFPSDFSQSPYTIIATGLTTLPQKVSFPFSLITLPQRRPQDVPEGWCQLIPGWMLKDNLYSVLRNIWKYKNRTKSNRTTINTEVFSDEVIKQLRDARERLEKNPSSSMPGIGKNYLIEKHRLEGIEIYRKCLRSIELWNKYQKAELSASETGEMLDLLQFAREVTVSSRLKDYKRGGRIIEDYLEVRTSPEEDEFLQIFKSFCTEIAENLRKMNNPKQI